MEQKLQTKDMLCYCAKHEKLQRNSQSVLANNAQSPWITECDDGRHDEGRQRVTITWQLTWIKLYSLVIDFREFAHMCMSTTHDAVKYGRKNINNHGKTKHFLYIKDWAGLMLS